MTFEEQKAEWKRMVEIIITEMVHQTDQRGLPFLVRGDKLDKFISSFFECVADIEATKLRSGTELDK